MKRMIIIFMMCIVFLTGSAIAQEPVRLKLNMLWRFEYLALLPEKASAINWNIINDLKVQLAPNDEELKLLDLKPAEAGGVIGNWEAVAEKEIVFGETAEKLIVDKLKELDQRGELSINQNSMYKIFVLKEFPEAITKEIKED